MSSPEDKPVNVVDIKQRHAEQAGADDRLGDLLKQVRGIALKRASGLVSSLFENVDDVLFDLAERAESNATQVQYFDGMREVRKKRQLVERLFLDQLSKIFNEFGEGRLKSLRPELTSQGGANLSLIDDQELEESLAISSMVSKAENRLARTLYVVNQRLSVISGGTAVDDSTNPIGPAPLCFAFRQAVAELELNLQVKLIIYKMFDRYVMSGLEPLYDEVNAELIRAGVLPQIRHKTPQGSGARRANSAGASGPTSPARPAGASDTSYSGDHYDDAAAEIQAELYSTLRGLLAGRRPHSDAGVTSHDGKGETLVPHLSPTDLLSALSILQGQSLTAQAQASSAADAAQIVRQMKQELLEQVHKLGGGDMRGHHVSTADEDTIDLVGMLFEYILQDRNLPSEIQALVGRLQIPYLKIAILDKHLFAQKSHPARRLLDAVAEAGKGWSAEADVDRRLYDRIKAVVNVVLTQFDDDLGIIERELASFEDFLQQHRRRSDLAEQRAAEVTRGREKLHASRRQAAREILSRIGQRELPPIIHDVLSRPWANYLVLTLLRQGAESDEWRNALRFADEFIWSSQPKSSDADKARLHTLLPQLEKALRHGLATVAYHESDVRTLMQDLSRFYQRLLSGDTIELKTAAEVITDNAAAVAAPAATDSGVASAPMAQAQSPVEEAVLSNSEPEAEYVPPVPADDDEALKIALAMKVGTWLEFVDEQGQRERAKLSWISPISSKYLFVNRRGLKVSDKTAEALAVELRCGSAIVLEEVPLFDRALDAIVERLRQSHPPAATEAGETGEPESPDP
ncbi:MAG: DUF1631 domain-containing protein [Dokdonella sp.]